MHIADAQCGVRQVCVGDFQGQLVSGCLWLVSAAVATWGSLGAGVVALFVGLDREPRIPPPHNHEGVVATTDERLRRPWAVGDRQRLAHARPRIDERRCGGKQASYPRRGRTPKSAIGSAAERVDEAWEGSRAVVTSERLILRAGPSGRWALLSAFRGPRTLQNVVHTQTRLKQNTSSARGTPLPP